VSSSSRRRGNGVERLLIGFLEKVPCSPDYPEILRLQVGHKIFLGIPFFMKKESVFILDTPAEVAALTSLLHPCGNGQ
jgi:hypothetical protein